MAAANYSQVMQDDRDGNNGPSPSLSLSPALSTSPIPFLPSVESTFTPLSMNSELYSSHDEIQHDDVALPHHSAEKLPAPSALLVTATTIARSVTESARATARNNEYDLLSPGDIEVDANSSVSSSPNLRNTSPTGGAQRDFLLSANEPDHHQTSPSDTVSQVPHAADQISVLNHNRDPICVSTKEPTANENDNVAQPDPLPPTIVRPTPILRTASTKSVTLVHPSPGGIRTRSSSRASNIAQLEATAEKLSMTSSIDDAIRDLHEEQKRSDSRRSSILAASIGSGPDPKEPHSFTRQLPSATSILEINNVARHGGYSPAGYVMSPNNSLLSNPSRLRSGSHTRSDVDSDSFLSRSGPGKSSVRSAISTTKPSLTDIAELEPTGLTLAAMDEADKLEEKPEDGTMRLELMDDVDLTPYAEGYNVSNANDYWDQAVAEAQIEQSQQHGEERPETSDGSTGTFEQAERAFADFDGAHCSPEVDSNAFDQSFKLAQPEESSSDRDLSRTMMSRPTQPAARPKSYMDPATGQQMLYYPARVPVMLNLPQKLSKKPKAAVTNKRKSQVLSAMPEANRKSAAWLPEIVPELIPEPLFDPLGSKSDLSTPLARPDSTSEDVLSPPPLEDEPQPQARPNPRPLDEEARKSRISVLDPADKRKSRMSYAIGNLPPQLRASAFFDMPSTESPALELKDGSAMATLESILDASAKAPVSAFTDHTYAGKLGTEVYGVEKKRKSHMNRASTADVLEVKKRSSFFHLRTPSKLSSKESAKADKRNTIMSNAMVADSHGAEFDDEGTRLSASVDGERVTGQNEDDDEDGEEEESEDEPAFNGPPTTLLAELQMRKQQQKLRTRPVARAYPNGLHSTLLEIDAVAELERRNRKGKRINLAWEEPNDEEDESDDEDVPLGLLAAAKNGGIDMVAAQAELSRPLGLMERRALEDNEPLSRRRDRLQGRDPDLMKRQSMMSLGAHGALGMGSNFDLPGSHSQQAHTPEEDEVEGETLGERLRRLKAREEGENALPLARPVSQAFSAEMFRQFGDTFKDEEHAESKDKGKQRAALPEDEETLGQRRRRLQAEREAREKEIGGAAPAIPTITKRHSLADVLGANSARAVLSDPRVDAERARQAEAERFRRDQDQKLAALRAQMPTNLTTPYRQRSGGYMAGQFNDGNGGGVAQVGFHGHPTPVLGNTMGMNGGGMVAGGGYGIRPVGGTVPGYGMQNGYGVPVANGYGMPLQVPMQVMPVPMQQPGQQYDRVNQWRQSIIP